MALSCCSPGQMASWGQPTRGAYALPALWSLVCTLAVLKSMVVTLPMVFLCLKGALVSFYTYLLLWHFPGK